MSPLASNLPVGEKARGPPRCPGAVNDLTSAPVGVLRTSIVSCQFDMASSAPSGWNSSDFTRFGSGRSMLQTCLPSVTFHDEIVWPEFAEQTSIFPSGEKTIDG